MMSTTTTSADTAPEHIECRDRFLFGWRIFGAAYHVERIDRRDSDGRRLPWRWEVCVEEVEGLWRSTTYHLGPFEIVRAVGITEEGRRRLAQETRRFCTLRSVNMG